jgi:hypothetical protein
MRCLSIKQPWAHAIIHLGKNIENREWPTSYRGLLAIHASKGTDNLNAYDLKDWSVEFGVEFPKPDAYTLGAIIGVVDLVDCLPLAKVEDQPWADGPWCFLLANPRPITPFPCRGALSLWLPPKGFVFP